MSSPNLPTPYQQQSGGLLGGRQSRALERSQRDLQSAASLELAHVRATEVIEQAKIEALETTSHIAFAATASVVEERQLRIERNPDGAAAFDFIGERTIRAIGNRIGALDRRLG